MAPQGRVSQGTVFSGAPPSNNLWIGNLTPDVTDAELTALFEKYGSLDSVNAYSSRGYGFVYFSNIDQAKAAREALQGTALHGSHLKIEFAKPAKPCKSLWVTRISQSVNNKELEEEFRKFGKIQEFKYIKDRNTAYVDYFKLEDASSALRNMNGRQFGGERIRVDFLRSQPSRREQGPDPRDMREGLFPNSSMGPLDARVPVPDIMGNYYEPMHAGAKRQFPFLSSGGWKGDGQLSNILCIRYPPSVQIDEDMLHNAMILFGEIEAIKTFHDRHYSFVEFRSIEEARRAKEGLQGKLFNDPRILIEYPSDGFAPSKDFYGYHPTVVGPRPDIYSNELPFQPPQIGVFGHNRPVLPGSALGHLPPRSIRGPDLLMRPLGPRGSLEPMLSTNELPDFAVRKFADTNPNALAGGSSWRRSSSPGMLSSPSAALKPPKGPASGGWDVYDSSQLQREFKRSRVDNALPAYGGLLSPKNLDDRGIRLEDHGFQGKNRPSPADARAVAVGVGQRHHGLDYVWRGVIAKGGTTVCHARCVPIGEGIESEIPAVVNCSARTGLDTLTEHYADAIGFDAVFFLPDSEEDFASYTEFLMYLSSKKRAGVAKFDDGTTLFLVPPSDFLTKVLNIAGPERLYGVVLKFPQHSLTSTAMQPDSMQPQYSGIQMISQAGYMLGQKNEEKVVPVDSSRALCEDQKLPPEALRPTNSSSSFHMHSAPPSSSAAVSQSAVTLTPELIATLTSLLPAKSSDSASAAVPIGSSTLVPERTGYGSQQIGSQYNSQPQLVPQAQAYPMVANPPGHSIQGLVGFSQMHDQTFNFHPQVAVPSRSSTTAIALPSGPVSFSSQPDQQYHIGAPQGSLNGHGIAQGTDSSGFYGSAFQQPSYPATMLTQVHSSSVSEPPGTMPPLASETGLSSQVQQLQSSLYGVGKDSSESEAEKNERYRSTILLAANLLSQIKQQQAGTQTGQSSGRQ